MDSQHRMMRATVGVAITKAVNDIEMDTKRAVRNLVDLGTLFASGDNQKNFFILANDVLANQQNPYNKMVLELTRNVDKEIIKTVGTNLGYSSLIYGVKQLRENTKRLECNIPWQITFHLKTDQPEALSFNEINSLIEQGRNLGIYSYAFSVSAQAEEKVKTVTKLAEKYYDCFFLLAVSPEHIDEEFALRIREVKNVVVSVNARMDNTGRLPSEESAVAFGILHQKCCMFGFHTFYSRENIGQVTSAEFLDRMIENHCLFGAYVLLNNDDGDLSEQVHRFSCDLRGANGKAILAFEWDEDSQYINKTISTNSGTMRIDSTGQVLWQEEETGENVHGKTMLQILKSIPTKR